MPFNLDRLKSFFQPKVVTRTGEKLYAACVTQSRLPVFYLDYGVEDDISARFELLTFHVGLVIYVLKSVSADESRKEQAADTAQALFDAFLLALDNTLREQGTGDLSVAKKMKPLGQVIYTRMKRWDEMWTHNAGKAEQADYAACTIFAGSVYADEGADDAALSNAIPAGVLPKAEAFAGYVSDVRSALSVDALLSGQVTWCEPAPLDTAA